MPLTGGIIPRMLSPIFQTVHFSPYYQLSILVGGAPWVREYTFPFVRYRIVLDISHTLYPSVLTVLIVHFTALAHG